MLQTFQQQPVKAESNCHLPVHVIQTHVPNVTAGQNMVAPQPTPPAEAFQQKTAFDKVVNGPVVFYMFIYKMDGNVIHTPVFPEIAGSVRLRRRTRSWRRIKER